MNGSSCSRPFSSSVARISSLLRTSTQSPARSVMVVAVISVLIETGSVIHALYCFVYLIRLRPTARQQLPKNINIQIICPHDEQKHCQISNSHHPPIKYQPQQR